MKMEDVQSAFDAFQNLAARTGADTPSLLEATSWPLSRFSFDYWGLISLYEDHWICRRIVDVVAEDMVRAWPAILGEISKEDSDRVERAIQRTQTRQALLTGLKWGRLFGGAGCLIVIEGDEDRLEEPLVLDNIMPGAYKGLVPFDMWAGIQPDASSICYDFDRPADVNKPEYYTVRMVGGSSFRVHSSRILRHVGYENPTPERETYQWWGISVLQPLIQEIEKRDNVSWNIANLTFRANILAMKDKELAERMSGAGSSVKAAQQWQRIMAETNRMMSNQSLLVVPPDGGLESTQYSFAGLDQLYVMFQLDIAGAAEIPFTRLWGRTVTGLGQLNESDERIYEERIQKEQEVHLRPQLEHKLFPVIMMSELGEVPEGFQLKFPSIRVSSDMERYEQAKAVTDACMSAFNAGILSPRAFARELVQSSTKTEVFTNITQEDIEALPEEPMLAQTEAEAEALPVPAPSLEARAEDSRPEGGSRNIHGLEVVVEVPRGSYKQGDGWRVMMAADYGHLTGIEGADGEAMDVYIGPHPESRTVYVVDQMRLDKPSRFDEHKVMLGFLTRASALDAYMRSHHKSGRVFGAITPMTIEGFLDWVARADLRRPCNSRTGRRWLW